MSNRQQTAKVVQEKGKRARKQSNQLE